MIVAVSSHIHLLLFFSVVVYVQGTVALLVYLILYLAPHVFISDPAVYRIAIFNFFLGSLFP